MPMRAEMHHKADKQNDMRSEKPTTDVRYPLHTPIEIMRGMLGENSALLPTSDGLCFAHWGSGVFRGNGVSPFKHPKSTEFWCSLLHQLTFGFFQAIIALKIH